MTWWIWILVGLALLVLEVVVPGGVFLVFFGVAALVVGALSAIGIAGPVWLQWLLFSIVSIASLLTLRRPILRRLKAEPEEDDKVDTLVGQLVIIVEELAPGAEGITELRGTSWTTRNVGESPLSPGQRGIVEKVEGLRLHVRAP